MKYHTFGDLEPSDNNENDFFLSSFLGKAGDAGTDTGESLLSSNNLETFFNCASCLIARDVSNNFVSSLMKSLFRFKLKSIWLRAC